MLVYSIYIIVFMTIFYVSFHTNDLTSNTFVYKQTLKKYNFYSKNKIYYINISV